MTKLLTRITVPDLEVRAISTEINKVAANRPELIEPIDTHADQPLQLVLA